MPTPRRSLSRLGGVFLASAVLLAGCGGGVPVIGGAASTGPSASAKATAAIDTAAGIRYAGAFVAALNKDPFVAHIEQVSTGTSGTGAEAFQVVATMSADFDGADIAFVLDATAVGTKIDVRVRAVGKNVYVYKSGTWVKVKRSKFKKELADTIEAVRFIKDPHDLQYLGQERVGKKDLQHFRANRDMPYDSGAGFKGNYDTLDIWVMKDGTPVRVEATFTASSKAGTIKGQAVMDFTKFGGPIKIKVPKNK
jgi:hypothetical protein